MNSANKYEPSVVGDNLKHYRRVAKLTQTELAAKVGCRQSTIVDIETGRIRKTSYLPEIAAVLGVPVDLLLAEGRNMTDKRSVLSYQYSVVPPQLVNAIVNDGVLPPDSVSEFCSFPMNVSGFAFKVESTFMSPVLQPGSIVLVDTESPIKNKSIVLASIGGHTAMCRIYLTEGGREYLNTPNGEPEEIATPGNTAATDVARDAVVYGVIRCVYTPIYE